MASFTQNIGGYVYNANNDHKISFQEKRHFLENPGMKLFSWA
jgi:hypothetical protein